jgi:hypothetical protein
LDVVSCFKCENFDENEDLHSQSLSLIGVDVGIQQVLRWHEASNMIWQAAPFQRNSISKGAEVGEVWFGVSGTESESHALISQMSGSTGVDLLGSNQFEAVLQIPRMNTKGFNQPRNRRLQTN